MFYLPSPQKYTFIKRFAFTCWKVEPVSLSTDEVTRVPADVLCEVERQLSALRLSLFKLLQPTLKCEIGKMVQQLIIKRFDICCLSLVLSDTLVCLSYRSAGNTRVCPPSPSTCRQVGSRAFPAYCPLGI